MSGLDRAELEQRLADAVAALAKLPYGSVEYRDAQSAARHLQRLVLAEEDLPPTTVPRRIRRQR